MKLLPLFGLIVGLAATSAVAKPADIHLYYNAHSANLFEINITAQEVLKVFDDVFGPDSEELPLKVQYADFYVSHYADDGYVFILNAPYNCGQIGCNTTVYRRDADGDLLPSEGIAKPVKCKDYSSDKLICIDGGYKPVPKSEPVDKPKGPIHYPAPRLR